jgi:hypothetical protein
MIDEIEKKELKYISQIEKTTLERKVQCSFLPRFYIIIENNYLRMLAFIRLPVPPASNTNPTSAISGVLNSPSSLYARKFVIGDECRLDTNADEILELNAKMNERRNKNIVVDFIVAEKRGAFDLL